MSGKKYQVFISSTYRDLKDARETVTKCILDLYHIPIGMEMFSADNNEQWDTIKTTIENSDYYVLIIGHRYGSVTKEGISFTEKEHDYAREIGVPILTFIRNRNSATTPDQRDKEGFKQKKLEAFINKASTDVLIDYWNEEKDLATKVIISLTKAFSKYDRIGWIRADEGVSPKVSEEMAILSKENRVLKEELKEIREQQKLRYPNFEVLLNNSESLNVKFIADSVLIGNSSLYLKEIEDIPPHLTSYTTYKLLEHYNDSVRAHASEIIKYNQNVLLKDRYENDSIPLSIDVKNTGTSKANNVVIELDFPTNLSIYFPKEKFKKIELKRPSYIPSNPIDVAIENKKQHESNFKSVIVGSRTVSNTFLKENENFTIKDNQLRLKFDHILHTQTESISNKFFLTALEPGNYVVKIKVMCAEYDSPQDFFLSVTVEE